MQGDPREIKTAGVITGGTGRDEFISTTVLKNRLKRRVLISSRRFFLPRRKKKSSVCASVCGGVRDPERGD